MEERKIKCYLCESEANQEDREKLSEYVRRHYNPEKVIPVRIDTKMIEVLTGKKSIND